MCILAWHYQPQSASPLLIIGNRDEYLARPTAALHDWGTGFWAGKDLVAYGTWLGLSPDGRLGAITNQRTGEPQDPQAVSRGQIIIQYLTSTLSASEFARSLETCSDHYQPFNLLLFDNSGLWGIEGGRTRRPFRIVQLPKGSGAVSNGGFETSWPKTERLHEHLNAAIDAGDYNNDERLFEMLRDGQIAPRQSLPKTGLPLERERALSSIFISTNGYGTRSHSIVRISQSGCSIAERSYDKAGGVSDNRFSTEKADEAPNISH
jgi:uncharacterized protein with NRDE domain